MAFSEFRLSTGNNIAEILGDIQPNNEGPSSIPAIISPITCGW